MPVNGPLSRLPKDSRFRKEIAMDLVVVKTLELEFRHLDLDHAGVGSRSSPAGHDAAGYVLEQLFVEVVELLRRCPAHSRNRVDHRAKGVDEADRERIKATPRRSLLDQGPDEVVGGEHRIDLLPDEVRALAPKNRGALTCTPAALMRFYRVVGQLDFPAAVVLPDEFLRLDHSVEEAGDQTGTAKALDLIADDAQLVLDLDPALSAAGIGSGRILDLADEPSEIAPVRKTGLAGELDRR